MQVIGMFGTFLEPKKPSRWDVSDEKKEKKDSISEFISLARSKVDVQQQPPVPATEACGTVPSETLTTEVSLQRCLNLKENSCKPSQP